MPEPPQARHPAAHHRSANNRHLIGRHLVHLLWVALEDTQSLLQAWAQNGEAETLHQARVAWRRHKCLLKFYKPLLPEPPQHGKAALQALWQLTGQLRNLDVALQSTLPAWRQDHPEVGTPEWPVLLHQLHRDRLHKCHALTRAVAKRQVAVGFQQLQIWMQRLDTVPLQFKRHHFKKWARQRLQRLHRKMRALRHPFSPERQHQRRILLKQERHALESLLTIQPDKKHQTQLKRIRHQQTAWGHAQDMQAALDLIEGSGLWPELTQAWRASMGHARPSA